MGKYTIRINDKDNNLLGDLDIPSGSDFPLVLNSSVASIRQLGARSGTFAYTFNIPATKNNNRILQSIFNADQRKDVKDILNKHFATVIVNGIQFDRGYIKVLNYDQAINSGFYEMNYFGSNLEWVKELEELTIGGLPFRNDSQVYDMEYVTNNQGQTVNQNDHVYALINRGSWEYDNAVGLKDYYPDLYVKAIFDLAFNSIGWKVESDFLNTDAIKKVGLSFSGDFKFLESDRDDKICKIQKEGTVIELNNATDPELIDFTDESSPGFYDNGNNYDDTNFIYTTPDIRYYNFKASLKTRSSTANSFAPIKWFLLDPSMNIIHEDFAEIPPVPYPRTSDSWATVEIESGFLALNAGEQLSLWIRNENQIYPVEIAPGSFLQVESGLDIDEGMTYKLSDVWSNKSYKVLDIITDFFKLENLYIQPDNRSRTVYIEPRDSFYKDNSTAEDITELIDHSNPVSIDFISEYNRELTYKFKDDSKDGWVSNFNEKNGTTIGEYTHTLPERFNKGTTTLSTKLVAPTVMMRDISIRGVQDFGGDQDDVTRAPIIARLWSDSNADGINPPKNTDFAPRFFHYVYGQQENAAGIKRRFYQVTTRTQRPVNKQFIPAAIAYNYENITVDHDFLFESDNGLFEKRYKKDTQIIESGLVVSLKAKMTAEHLQNLDFRKKYYINYPDNIKGYYIIQSYSDFNPATESVVSLDLLKVKKIDGAVIQEKKKKVDKIDIDNIDDWRGPPDGTGIVKEGGGIRWDDLPVWTGPGRGSNGFPSRPTITVGDNAGGRNTGGFVDGVRNQAPGREQVVTGRYNDPNTTDVFQVGTGSSETSRINAISVDENGDVNHYGGEIYYLNASGEMQPVFYTSPKGDAKPLYKYDKS